MQSHKNTIEKNISGALETLLNELTLATDKAILSVRAEKQAVPHVHALVEGVQQLTTLVMKTGDLCFEQIEQTDQKLLYGLIGFEWVPRAKAFLLLWRDVIFQEQKAWLQVSVGNGHHRAFRTLQEASEQAILFAAHELKYFINDVKASIPDEKVLRDRWRLQQNPWPVYKKQIKAIPTQSEHLAAQLDVLLKVGLVYEKIRVHFSDVFSNFIADFDALRAPLAEMLDEVGTTSSEYDSDKIVARLEALFTDKLPLADVKDFDRKADILREALPAAGKYSVAVRNGLLLYKELDLKFVSDSWLESEVMADVYEFFTIRESIRNNFNMSIVNIKNRIAFEKQDARHSARKDILQALTNLISNQEKSRGQILEVFERVSDRIGKHLSIPNLYEDKFLEVSLQSTMNKYQRRQLESIGKARKWLGGKVSFITQLQKIVREEEALSVSEKIVRVVRQRTCPGDNINYANMFLTNGYVGDSFWVGREEELVRAGRLVENWSLGFRGALMITGKRFSGKSLLGELISQKYFSHKTIRLKPKIRINAFGRDLDPGYDLGASLSFVTKYSLGEKLMVWIDDLELWQNDKTTLAENVGQLVTAMDNFSGRLFFVVSMSNWTHAHANKFYEIDKSFQSEINTDRMSFEDIKQAILIRHSATHMDLMDSAAQVLGRQELDKQISRICRFADGNIGEALHRWAYSVKKEERHLVFADNTASYQLPDFLSPDSALLLKTILLLKHTNEYQLRKQFGPAFKEHYKVILQRLINLGLVKRALDGWLKVNMFVVNDIGKLLEKKMSFSFGKEQVVNIDSKL